MYIKKIINFLLSVVKKKTIFKQEFLLRKALIEKGIDSKKLIIKCNHDLGLNNVNGLDLGIKYPDSFFYEAKKLISNDKRNNIYFNGYINDSGGRKELLKPFKDLSNTVIISSGQGRVESKKDIFNKEYFQGLSDAKFGLCPHQEDWPGSKKHMWTYRFIECCFAGSIPVLFKATPLGKNFIDGYFYLWDHDFYDDYISAVNKYNFKMVKHNQELAREQFCLSDSEVESISLTL